MAGIPLPPDLEAEAQRRAETIVAEQQRALELTGLAKTLEDLRLDVGRIRRWMSKADKKLAESNHLRRDMATRQDIASALQTAVIRTDIGDGDYIVRIGENLVFTRDQLVAIAATADQNILAAKNAAAHAHQAAEAVEKLQVRNLVVTMVAAIVGTLIAGAALLVGVLTLLHYKGLF